MKAKFMIGLALVLLMMVVASPALALDLGASPPRVEFEVPGGGSTTIDIQIHYFDGNVQVSLINIPLRIEPAVISVEASENPMRVQLTVYGDESLGSQVYDGYIRLTAVSGEAATGAVQIITKVTHITNGTPVEAEVKPAPTVIAPNPTADKPVAVEPVVKEVLPVEKTPQVFLPSPLPSPETGLTVPQIAGIIITSVIVIVFVIVLAKRRRYQR